MYTSPDDIPYYELRKLWKKHTKFDKSYHIIVAQISVPGFVIQVMIVAVDSAMLSFTVEEFVAGIKDSMQLLPEFSESGGVIFEDINTEVIYRKGREIGIIELKVKTVKVISVWFKEKEEGRYVAIYYHARPKGRNFLA